MRRTLGTAVFSGMLGVTLFGIFLTPVFFYVIDRLGETRLFASPVVRGSSGVAARRAAAASGCCRVGRATGAESAVGRSPRPATSATPQCRRSSRRPRRVHEPTRRRMTVITVFSRFFIDRPIFASVLSIVITLAGGIALFTLPVAQYPEITPPTVEVSASIPGANAQVVADTVAAPIEQQVNGVEDMLYMSSQCTNDGTYTLTVTFKLGIDLNMAQVLVQNRVVAGPADPARPGASAAASRSRRSRPAC